MTSGERADADGQGQRSGLAFRGGGFQTRPYRLHTAGGAGINFDLAPHQNVIPGLYCMGWKGGRAEAGLYGGLGVKVYWRQMHVGTD